MKLSREDQVRRYFEAVDDLLKTDKSMQSIFEISKRFSSMTAVETMKCSGGKTRISYQSYFDRIYAAASLISEKFTPIENGSVVGLKLANSPTWGVLFWALLITGYKPLLLDAKAEFKTINTLLADAGAKALICEDTAAYIVPYFSSAELIAGKPRRKLSPQWENHVLFCTSGTTGTPRVIVFSGQNLSYQIISARSMPERTCDIMYPPELGNLKILALLPFHHIFGFVAVFLWYTFFGKTLVFLEDFLPETILDTCRRLKVSHVYAVPLLWNNIAQTLTRRAALNGKKQEDILKRLVAYHTHAISKREAGYGASRSLFKKIQINLLGRAIVYCISGGGLLPAQTQELINGVGYPLYNGYGLTEVGVTSVELDNNVRNRIKGSIGRPLYLIEYRIAPLPNMKTSTGELLIKSNTTHVGTMKEGIFTPREDTEWYHTGDIVSVDGAGNYYFKGRIRDTIINSDGENVFPDEIEGDFAGLSFVEHLSVLGVSYGDESRERITMVLKLARTLTQEEHAQLCSEIREMNGRFPIRKQIQDIFIASTALPVVSTIKVQRSVLREMLHKQPEAFTRLNAMSVKGFSDIPLEYIQRLLSKVRDIFAQVLNLDVGSVTDTGHFVYDLGGDSLLYAGLILAIEKNFDLTIPVTEYGRCYSVYDFAVLIVQLRKGDIA